MILIDKPIPEDCDDCFCNDDDDRCGLLNERFPLHFSGRLPNCPLREMEKSDEPISRQAAIDAFAKFVPYAICDASTESYTNGLTDAYNLICQLPSVQPEPQWIPCSERLPEELEEVNVTWVNHKPEPYYDFVKDKPFTASAVYYKGDWYWYSSVCTDLLAERGENEIDKIDDAIEITAWMPLPECYKGES